ncbi:MAG: OmpA family protein [Myxococcota bacterium]
MTSAGIPSMTYNQTFFGAGLGLALFTALGCQDSKTPADVQPTPRPATDTTVVVPPAADSDKSTVVAIDRELVRACNLPEPNFAFDSARLRDRAEPPLDRLASCLINNRELEGRKLQLIGHTDERGSADYNLALGQRRAGEVAEYLTDAGVAEPKVVTHSRGEMDADGTGPDSWADDRRVEIRLMKPDAS